MMNKLKVFFKKYFSWINAYWVVVFAFVILFLAPGDSSFFSHYKYDQKIRSLEKEIDNYQKIIDVNNEKINSLKTDSKGLERFAREEYYMKRENEDVFIIKDKK